MSKIMIDAELMAKHILQVKEKLRERNRTTRPENILEEFLRREVKFQHPDILNIFNQQEDSEDGKV